MVRRQRQMCIRDRRGSMAVLAASDTGGLFNAPDFYMNKLAAPPAAKGKVDIRNSATENLKILSDCWAFLLMRLL